jgi:hypothetical protein
LCVEISFNRKIYFILVNVISIFLPPHTNTECPKSRFTKIILTFQGKFVLFQPNANLVNTPVPQQLETRASVTAFTFNKEHKTPGWIQDPEPFAYE